VRIAYVGGFLPLHGVAVMLEAAAQLEARAATLPPFVFEMVGAGIEYGAARDFVARRGLARVEFTGRQPYADAPRALARSHVALGAFGTGEKAGRVIPHKLYQGLAAGRAVVSGDGPGVREVFTHGVHLLLTPRGDAAALAGALAALIEDPARRAALGAAARERSRAVASVDAVGRTLADAIAERAA